MSKENLRMHKMMQKLKRKKEQEKYFKPKAAGGASSRKLSRPDPANPRVERVIASDIDLVVIVVSVAAPPLRPGLIDRYLIAAERGGAEALICVNKIDLLTDKVELSVLDCYRSLAIPVLGCSTVTGAGIDELSHLLAGKACVFTGHSGVGKSSVLNALLPGASAHTGDVSEVNGKGRHTTTSTTTYTLPNGAKILDTPGIRQFGLWQVTAKELRLYFHEFEAYRCRFSDCSHAHEAGCGVKDAAERGAFARSRYDAYLRILSTL